MKGGGEDFVSVSVYVHKSYKIDKKVSRKTSVKLLSTYF